MKKWPRQPIVATVDDMRSQLYIYGNEQKVKGLRNTEFPFDSYLTGCGAVTADATQIAQTGLMTLGRHCLGGLHRSNRTAVTGGTTTQPTVTSVTNIVVGCLVGFIDTSEGSGRILDVRRVMAINTLTLTLDEALSFAPVNGDVCAAIGTLYDDESVLANSAVGPQTFSWLGQKGLAAALENFQFMGCKSALQNIELPRGQLPLMKFHTLAANYLAPGDTPAPPSPAWAGNPDGYAPVALGPATEWQYQSVGTTTSNRVHLYRFGLDVGVPVVPIDTNGEVQANMQGREAYTTAPADTLVKIGMDFSISPNTNFNANTLKYLRFTKIALPGQGCTIYIPRAEIASAPKRGRNGDVSAIDVDLRSLPDTSGSTALLRAKILIGIH